MATTQKASVSGEPKKVLDESVHEDAGVQTPIVIQDNEATKDYTRDLAFMNEAVEVMVLETQTHQDSTRLVTVSINGKAYYFLRGTWRKCPRFVLEVLIRAKRENWNFSYKKNSDGSTSDINQMHRMLRFPHQFRDTNPVGAAWYDSIKEKSM
jgi:hypothetical protein